MKWIYNNQYHQYQQTEDDLLWLARAVAREGKPYDAVAWTLLQRFALLYPTYPTLAAFVQAYSQPVNPRWFPDGDKHLAAMKANEDNPEKQKELLRRAERRPGYASAEWQDIPEKIRRLCLAVLNVDYPSPVPGSVHFTGARVPKGTPSGQGLEAAKRLLSARRDLNRIITVPGGFGFGYNWFFGVRGSDRLSMLADDEDDIIPKDQRAVSAAQFPGAPPGAPTGAGWGWCWAFSPSKFSEHSAKEEAETEKLVKNKRKKKGNGLTANAEQ